MVPLLLGRMFPSLWWPSMRDTLNIEKQVLLQPPKRSGFWEWWAHKTPHCDTKGLFLHIAMLYSRHGRSCIFQHVGIFAPDYGIAQQFIIRFSNGFQHCDGDLISFPVIRAAKLSVKYCLITIAAMNIAGEYENIPS